MEPTITNPFTFRLCEPKDAENCAKWAAENPQIDASDLLAGTKKRNPTILFFAVENADGVIVAYCPMYLQMTAPFLGFNPAASGDDRRRALRLLTDGISAMAVQYGIRELTVLSKADYPVAQFAVSELGFDLEPRQVLKLDLNKTLTIEENQGVAGEQLVSPKELVN
jgi:hypothetical protein